MAHDVFISHARKDKVFADAICEKLESAELRCWIAERDISAGDDWTEATRNAIGFSRVIVLVLSENANAAPHIEREIAHAFYTGRIIVPLRLTDTLPRSDFLFYLSNVRWFDAFGLPAGQHLDAFTATIHGMVRDSAVGGHPVPPPHAIDAPGSFSDSRIGAQRPSRHRTLEIVKRVALAGTVVGCLWWVAATWQARTEVLPEADSQSAMFSDLGAPRLPAPQAKAEAPTSKPAYAYSRFGLWVAPNPGPTTSDLQEPPAVPTTTPGSQPVRATSAPPQELDPKEAAEAESPDPRDGGSPLPAQGDRSRTTNRQELRRNRAGQKRHARGVHASPRSFVGHFKRRLKEVWHQFVERSKESN
jgi:hypothetical protein